MQVGLVMAVIAAVLTGGCDGGEDYGRELGTIAIETDQEAEGQELLEKGNRCLRAGNDVVIVHDDEVLGRVTEENGFPDFRRKGSAEHGDDVTYYCDDA